MEIKAFENVREQIGFCGIWCASCAAGNGAIAELTRRYEEIVKNYNLEKWAPKDFNFGEFMKGLTSIQTMPSCPGCRKGGGDPMCKIRICALEKGAFDCSQCNQLARCVNFEQLEENPKVKENLTKIKNSGRKEVVERWYRELKTKWPHCIVLCDQVKK